VSRQEIVEGYLGGQLSRRVFIRRLVATGVTAAVAINYAGLLDADPAVAGEADYYLVASDNSFSPNPLRLRQGEGTPLYNHGSAGHNAHDITGLGLFQTVAIGHYNGHGDIPAMPGAGSFDYKCDEVDHPRMVGTIKVPILVTPASGNLNTTFLIRWAPGPAPAGLVFDVQRIKAGQRNFTAWRTGVRAGAANFHPASRGLYTFRARVRKTSNNRASGWSPLKRVRVN
jgi:hypothetical protein